MYADVTVKFSLKSISFIHNKIKTFAIDQIDNQSFSAHRMAEMEKRRIGTRFLDREVTEADKEKPLIVKIQESCKVM